MTALAPSADDFLQGGDHLPDNADKLSSPEVALWLAVVARVWEDAFVSTNATLKTTDLRCEPDMVRAEARRWLLLDFGTWREDREAVCIMAGLDPDAIHEAALRRNKLAVVEDQERDRLEREAIDRAMERLAEREHRLPRTHVSSSLCALAARELALA